MSNGDPSDLMVVSAIIAHGLVGRPDVKVTQLGELEEVANTSVRIAERLVDRCDQVLAERGEG